MKTLLIITYLLFTSSCKEEVNNIEPKTKVDLSEKLNLVWKSKRVLPYKGYPGRFYKTMYSIINDRILVGKDEFIEMFNKNTGKLIWRIQLDNYGNDNTRYNRMNEFIIECESFYFIDRHIAYKIDLTTGEILWKIDFGSSFNMALRYTLSCHSITAIFISERATGTSNQKVYAISKTNGSMLWESKSPLIGNVKPGFEGGNLIESPSYSLESNTVYVGTKIGCCEGSLIALDAETGNKKWETKFKIPEESETNCNVFFPTTYARYAPNVVSDGIIIRSGTYCTKLDFDGNILWQTLEHHDCDYGDTILGGLIYNNHYYNYAQGKDRSIVYKINIMTGKLIWSNYLDNGDNDYNTIGFYESKVVENKLYKLADNGWLFGTNIETGNHDVLINLPAQEYIDPETGEVIKSGCHGGFAVEGDRIYYLGNDYLFCGEIIR